MWGRFFAAAFAVLFVLPVVLLVDVIRRPKGAWERVERSRWLWAAGFLAAPSLSAVTTSYVPAMAVLPLSAYYLARVRSVLDVSTGLDRAERQRPAPSAEQREALAPLLYVYPPVLLLLGIIVWAGPPSERLLAAAIAVPVLVLVGAVVWWNHRRAPRSDGR